MFYGLSEKLSFYQKTLGLFVALGPVTRLDHCSADLLTKIANVNIVTEAIKKLHIYEMFPYDKKGSAIFSSLCSVLPQICDFSLSLISDSDPTLNNVDRIDEFMAHYPCGTSFKAIDHYGQIMRSK